MRYVSIIVAKSENNVIGSNGQLPWHLSEDLKKFNYSEEDLMNGTINENWKALMAFQLARARDWFQKSEEGIKWLSIDARWPIWTSLRLYSGILSAIEKLDYDISLLDWIRTKLNLKGTKEGCNEGDCGACSVLVLDKASKKPKAINSCLVRLGQMIGRNIITIEGIGNSNNLTVWIYHYRKDKKS